MIILQVMYLSSSLQYLKKSKFEMGKEKQICAEVPGFSSPFSLINQPSVYYSHESLTLRITP
jgi:hypothetical protein